ncbi:MAG: PH domain-containing protein [Phycisphaerales bacterium]|nr:PH domain-containing protein [Phycisphaerales bacterium]
MTAGNGIGEGSVVYRGIKGLVARILRIPLEPASIPVNSGELLDSFHPAPGWIRLRRIQVLLAAFSAVVINIGLAVGFSLLNKNSDWMGWLFLLPVIIIPCLLKITLLRLQYDCTWYVLTARSLRIRRGLWVIHETTITYANIQNVTVRQGPIERLFGLSNIEVETAGGGGTSSDSSGPSGDSSHTGRIEGVNDPEALRDRIMSQVRKSRSSGLGDEPEQIRVAGSVGADADWSRLAGLLREIRDDLQGAGAT